jgi:hypothetical protein
VEGEVLLELVDGGEVLLVARLGELLQRGVGAVDVACSSPGHLPHAERLRDVHDAAQDGERAQGVEDEEATGTRDRAGQGEPAKSRKQGEHASS